MNLNKKQYPQTETNTTWSKKDMHFFIHMLLEICMANVSRYLNNLSSYSLMSSLIQILFVETEFVIS